MIDCLAPKAPPIQLVLATGNLHKIQEFQELLAPLDWNITSAKTLGLQLPTEPAGADGATLNSNAALKAEFICEKTSSWALADDSGLFVKALPHDLGVDTATYGGVALLLAALANQGRRQACFRCVLALARPNAPTLYFTGEDHGTISHQALGTAGLTYDPVFIQEGHTLTNSERIANAGLAAVKGQGHRGKAVQTLMAWAQQNRHSC
jgi:XTP/dITP diphosphohydrolase